MNDKNLKALLKGVGLPDTILEDIEKPEFDAKEVVATYNESQKEHFKPLIENEIRPDIEKEITDARNGHWLNTLNNDIKKFGIPLEKIKDLKVHEKLKVMHDILADKYKQADSGEAVKLIQEENVNLKNQLSEWETKLITEVEKIRKEESSKTVSKLVDLDLKKKFNSIPADEILGKKHSDGIFLGLKSFMATKYDFGIDEKEQIIPYEKGTQKRVQGKNKEGKEYFVPIEDLLLNSLDELSMRNKSNGGEGSGQGGQGSGGNKQRQKSQRLLEMEAKIASNQ